ncbi:probable F-box protein At4g22165 [Hordeum vulgare subsp. vulgare]|uniref:F-box domain-containing protein n=1 Tax=Hordeum vulgare subsp. vulgare TaxID=112509 RepID=A0A8I6XEV5_HORVV|nr:probable F-box protein At4g22165 [Hordeum vulgare subsp. vulgare]
MEACSLARTTGLWSLPIHPRMFFSTVFRVLPKLLGLPPSLMKKFLKIKHEHIHPPHMEIEVGGSPELPHELLVDIFALLEIPDLKRASSVCSSWRSAYTSLCNLGLYKRPQTPCLLYTSESAGESVAFLYSLAEKRSYKLTLPDPPMHTRYLIGSTNGWLVTADERSEMHLLNPITCQQIALPSVITIEHVTPIFDEAGALSKYHYSRHTGSPRLSRFCTDQPSILALAELRSYLHEKAFVFYDAYAGGHIVVLIHSPDGQLSFARLGDDKWTWLSQHSFFHDCIYKDGLLYAVTSQGKILAFNLRGPVVTTELIMDITKDFAYENIYIAQAPCGGLLQVWRTQEDSEYVEDADPATYLTNTANIKIFKVDTMAEKLVGIDSLDDHVLLLGLNQTLYLSVEEYPHLKANHVYFTDDCELYLFGWKNNRRDIGIYDLANNTCEELVSPQLWPNWPNPIWITPSLTRL